MNDWPKSEFAAYIFGGNELPDRFFTASHEFVIIDSEQMFSSGPCQFETASWLKQRDGSPSKSGQALAIEVCREVAKLSPKVVAQALSVPDAIQVELRWPIEPKLRASIKFARAYAQENKGA
ncbi:hypothetical protein [Pseudomonas cavernicola]|uniref:hypothetical protein n=1 Tax=Pseudomonas cavernicola TaxID=2320866 RepID=UPI0011C34A95|nr:hypothetical protein [Pseudomonas cavernicola]